jgi:hypothetical protein
MSNSTESHNWGAVSLVSVNANAGLGFRGTIYEFRNMDNGNRFSFLLASLGVGFALGFRINQILRNFYKAATKRKDLNDPALYTKLPVKRRFSADDLAWSPGAEATIGVTLLVAGCTVTLISAWPFFQGAPEPGEVVDNDYFSGAEIVSLYDLGLGAQGAYHFMGRWIRL